MQKDGVKLRTPDIVVFAGLETLGLLAVIGNLCLVIVLVRNKYLHRASFILMLSLACADVLHGICTTSYFYPPILLKHTWHEYSVRIFNIIDWSAWSITLTHMTAICLDRLIAIMLYGQYNQIVTVERVKKYSIGCWITFITLNMLYFVFDFCCLIRPLSHSEFYSFGYDENKINNQSFMGSTNMYMYTYTPTEITTLIILSISNPITLAQLYRRHKRKLALRQNCRRKSSQDTTYRSHTQWQRASTMLIEMSMRIGSRHSGNDAREVASRKANRQQQRILFQISVVAAIFYMYMTTYYLVYYIFETENKWVMLFNSFFYSTTHMINPVIYFSLNKEMRANLRQAMSDFVSCICGNRSRKQSEYGRMSKPSVQRKTSTRLDNSFTETSPLFSSALTGIKATSNTISRQQRESLTRSLSQLASRKSSSSSPNQIMRSLSSLSKKQTQTNSTTMTDLAEQRRSLLDALIRALSGFTNDFSEEENTEVVAAVIENHMSRFHPQSKSFDLSRPNNNCYEKSRIRESSTADALAHDRENSRSNWDCSQSSIARSTDLHSDPESSTSEQFRIIIMKSDTFRQYTSMKQKHVPKGKARESLTFLLNDTSLPNSDDEDDVVFL